MIAVNGIYENGEIKLEKKIDSKITRKVIVTFLEEEPSNDSTRLTLKDFSFHTSRKKTKGYKGNLSESVIEERRKEL
jgi:hypothetical protein